MSPRKLRSSSLILVVAATVALGGVMICSGPAQAKNPNWPPPKTATSADVKNPMYWPDDPDWGYGGQSAGEWGLYGFQPDRYPGFETTLRAAEMSQPSGVSLDLAMRFSIGDPRIIIAVLDSGIKWDQDDVTDKAHLNKGELAKHMPKDANGKACGGTGDLAGWDCNGDGILNIDDYADDPDLIPAAAMDGTMSYPRGDKNHNGLLDAGDLILNFSDGTDDDKNGYVDDIAGWDFLLDDNDPYEDTRYYHGSLIERTLGARANNGDGGVGTCPECQIMHVRVGETFIADTQSFAKGIMYAVDAGAKVVQCALGTIDKSTFTQDAIKYAWKHGVIVSTSMADEDSKHHNQPNTANYTLSSHAIVSDGDGDDPRKATSELCFDTGTNYGGQNYLSVTTGGASSTASAMVSGLSGLVMSYGLQLGLNPALSPGETYELLIMNTDDIDVPESRMANAKYFWSQPGWDQRFGYGRVDANLALQALDQGKIPPVVTVTSPEWFENLYVDRTQNPVPLMGEISAVRSNSYDYVVEWAPGVQPLDTDFQMISTQSNIAPTTTSGDMGAPLAMIDITKIDPTHTRDVDSPAGENDRAFTVRVRATAHYGGTVGDVPGEYRRTYYLPVDPDLMKGFPIHIEASGESSPKLADIDGDGVDDLVLATADGQINVWKITAAGPTQLTGFPFQAKLLDGLETTPLTPGTANYRGAVGYGPTGVDPSGAREAFFSTVAIADVDNDGKIEIVGTTYNGTIYIVESDGTVRPGWPQRMPYVPSCPLDPTVTQPPVCMDPTHLIDRGATASPVLADMNMDGKLDVIQAGFDGRVYVYNADGTTMPGWPVLVHYDGKLAASLEYSRIIATPAVSDMNGDGIPDVLVPSGERVGDDGSQGAFYLIDGRGSAVGELPNWPITMASLQVLPLLGWGITTAGVIGDIDGDGKPEAIFHGNVTAPLIVPGDPGAQASIGATPPNSLPKTTDAMGVAHQGVAPTSFFGALSTAHKDTMFPLFAQPSLADLDMDGTVDIITAGGSLSLAGNLLAKGSANSKPSQFLVAMWSGKTGNMMPGSPVPVEDFMFSNSQVIADLNNDGYPEVITGTGGYLVRAFDACAREAPGFPKNTGQWVLGTLATSDIDGDGNLDLVTATRDGWVYAWKTQGKASGVQPWPTFHHDNRNTGDYSVKLPHGVLTSGAPPLDCGAAAAGAGGAGGSAGTGGGSSLLTTGGGAGASGKATMSVAGSGGAAGTTAPSGSAVQGADDEGGGCSVPNGSPNRSRSAFAIGIALSLLALRRRRAA